MTGYCHSLSETETETTTDFQVYDCSSENCLKVGLAVAALVMIDDTRSLARSH